MYKLNLVSLLTCPWPFLNFKALYPKPKHKTLGLGIILTKVKDSVSCVSISFIIILSILFLEKIPRISTSSMVANSAFPLNVTVLEGTKGRKEMEERTRKDTSGFILIFRTFLYFFDVKIKSENLEEGGETPYRTPVVCGVPSWFIVVKSPKVLSLTFLSMKENVKSCLFVLNHL